MCEKHLAEKFVVCVESVTVDDDSVLTVTRQAKLTADARTRRCFPTLRLTRRLNHLVLKGRTPEDRLLD